MTIADYHGYRKTLLHVCQQLKHAYSACGGRFIANQPLFKLLCGPGIVTLQSVVCRISAVKVTNKITFDFGMVILTLSRSSL